MMCTDRRPNTAVRTLEIDYMRLKKDPVPYIAAEPLPSNILEWHYVINGPESTPYKGGYYHGKITFPPSFPFKPPAIYMITPNGRFEINTKLCLSMSEAHPETWNPVWNVSTILLGLLSFMTETSSTGGSITTRDDVKKALAFRSLKFNIQNKLFCDLFPDIVIQIQKKLDERVVLNESEGILHSYMVECSAQSFGFVFPQK